MSKIKGLLVYIMLSLIISVVVSCGNPTDDTGSETDRFQGIIYSLEENQILVIQDLDDVNVPWSYWFETGKRAVSFSIVEGETIIENGGDELSPEALARGQRVEVWHSGALAESYPEQGRALKVMILDPQAAEEALTDSGRYAGLINNDDRELILIRISGIPDQLPPRSYRLTAEAAVLVDNLSLTEGTEIIFRYLSDEQSDGLIFDLSRL